ncbi:MAG: protein kinase [Muribaculaceae bacterium]|nr:protein kinase [Muribaculaceae bacterium]
MSQFIDTGERESSQIDFGGARRLPGGGTTCDLYRTRWQRREVFVKRLKEVYRTQPLYLDAMEKEFEVGVTLHHPSLPEYRELHRDYIVMDFIDGSTLASMMRQGDPWLARPRNVRAMLRELVDAVDYLHRHNVAHCDIKPDNIMITARTKHLVLIDFDKSYTDALNDTCGDPARYGLHPRDAGSCELDFRGIALVAEQLQFPGRKRFVRTCLAPQASCERLSEILNGRRRIWPVAVAAVPAAVGICAYLYNISLEKEDSADTIAPATQEQLRDTVEHTIAIPIKQEELLDEAERMAAVLDERIAPAFNELHAGLDRLAAIKNDSTYSGWQMLDSIRAHDDRADEYISEAFEILNETFPGLSEREKWRVMGKSKVYTGYTRSATPEMRDFGHELERRITAAGEKITADPRP